MVLCHVPCAMCYVVWTFRAAYGIQVARCAIGERNLLLWAVGCGLVREYRRAKYETPEGKTGARVGSCMLREDGA